MRFLLLFLLFLSCDRTTSTICEEEKIALTSCNEEVEQLFQDNGRLKENQIRVEEYLNLLEQENEYLRKQNDSLKTIIKK